MKHPLTEFGIRVHSELGKRGITYRDLAREINVEYFFMCSVLHGVGVSNPMEQKIKDYFRWE